MEYQRRVKTGVWLAIWYLPTIPVTKKIEHHFLDDTHWEWPEATASWKAFTGDGPRVSPGVFPSGGLRTNLDDPEQES